MAAAARSLMAAALRMTLTFECTGVVKMQCCGLARLCTQCSHMRNNYCFTLYDGKVHHTKLKIKNTELEKSVFDRFGPNRFACAVDGSFGDVTFLKTWSELVLLEVGKSWKVITFECF